MSLRLAQLASFAVVVWLAVIIASGAGWNPLEISWNFSNSGAFGDSFGPLGACMAALAAWSAIAAYRSQQSEIARLHEREAKEEIERHKIDFERTFFFLLQSLREIVNSIDIEIGQKSRIGQDAFRSMLRVYVNSGGPKNPDSVWSATFERYKNDLGHYFRFLYHLIGFVDRETIVDRYFYVRLVRASLSDSEIALLGLNCAFGEGQQKFAPLLERYALLHNLGEGDRKLLSLDSKFSEGAFDPVVASQTRLTLE